MHKRSTTVGHILFNMMNITSVAYSSQQHKPLLSVQQRAALSLRMLLIQSKQHRLCSLKWRRMALVCVFNAFRMTVGFCGTQVNYVTLSWWVLCDILCRWGHSLWGSLRNFSAEPAPWWKRASGSTKSSLTAMSLWVITSMCFLLEDRTSDPDCLWPVEGSSVSSSSLCV